MTNSQVTALNIGRIEVVDEAIAEILRKKTYAERIEMVGEAHRTARMLVRGMILHDHPEWSQEDVLAEVNRRMLGGTD